MTSEQTKKMLVDKLEGFYKNLLEYYKLGITLCDAKSEMTKYPAKEWGKFQALRQELLDLYGGLRVEIEKYGGPTTVRLQSNVERNAFGLALSHMYPSKETFTALDGCTSVVRLAIGKLKSLTPEIVETGSIGAKQGPKAFIAHGGESIAQRKLCEFLDSLEIVQVIAEKEPSEDRSVNEQVDWCLAQSDCAIVLATKGDIDGKTGKWIPRGNILIEIGKIQERFPRKTVYLLEEGATFPTDISEKVWERFTHECMDKAFIKVAKELVAFGIVKAVKP